MNFFAKVEKKFGRFGIKNITIILIACYAAGFIIDLINPDITYYLTLNPYLICHGQVWRLVTWLLIPPRESNIFFAIIMLVFYLSVGTTLERSWGTFWYNVYLFSGMLFTILGSFLLMGFCCLFKSDYVAYNGLGNIMSLLSPAFSTYYINMSIFLAYAATFPQNEVLLFFIIPVKVKWMGFVYAGFLVYEVVSGIIQGGPFGFTFAFVIGASTFNFLIFFVTTRRYMLRGRFNNRARRSYAKKVKFNSYVNKAAAGKESAISKHKCAVCGRTEKSDENLSFRFCSKCEGNFEYCEEHLYSHIHYKKGDM